MAHGPPARTRARSGRPRSCSSSGSESQRGTTAWPYQKLSSGHIWWHVPSPVKLLVGLAGWQLGVREDPPIGRTERAPSACENVLLLLGPGRAPSATPSDCTMCVRVPRRAWAWGRIKTTQRSAPKAGPPGLFYEKKVEHSLLENTLASWSAIGGWNLSTRIDVLSVE
jgi:hypothetical protein